MQKVIKAEEWVQHSMPDSLRPFWQNLMRAADSSGETLESLSTGCEKPKDYLRGYMERNWFPHVQVVVKVARFLDMQVEELMLGEKF